MEYEANNLNNSHIHNRNYIGIARICDLLIGIDIPPIIVINLSTRVDRANKVVETMKSHQPPIPFMFFTAQPHNNPVRGCLESHISIVKWARLKNYKAVCIFEDDFIIRHALHTVPSFPFDWDMMYLGGLCTHIREWGSEIPRTTTHPFYGNKWIKGTFYCDHAYLIRDTVYDKIIAEGWNYTRELDRFYTSEIHDNDKYNVYMPYVQYVVQYNDWSDIDLKNKWNSFTWPNPGDMFNVP